MKYQYNNIQNKYFHKVLEHRDEKESSDFSKRVKDHLDNLEDEEDNCEK